jgi:hypothetical protein
LEPSFKLQAAGAVLSDNAAVTLLASSQVRAPRQLASFNTTRPFMVTVPLSPHHPASDAAMTQQKAAIPTKKPLIIIQFFSFSRKFTAKELKGTLLVILLLRQLIT